MLGDVDKQLSSKLWLSLRPPEARAIATWDISPDQIVKPPKGTTHVVLDTPAGLHGWRFNDVLRLATKVVVPLQASIFDIYATRQFLDDLAEKRRAVGLDIAIVGMRMHPRTIAAEQLRVFVEGLGLPVLGYLRDTQNYVHLSARGLSLFDVSPARVARDLEQWQGICNWLDA
jgi:chromosome partitioning protein